MLGNRQIEDINYMVSLYCPGRCRRCNIWRSKRSEITKGELPSSLFQTALQSSALKEVQYVDLTAGESQLSPRYVDIVKTVSSILPRAFIHTNISGWYPKIHRRVTQSSLEHVDPNRFRLDISIDGRPENYAKLRWVPGGYDKALRTVDALLPLGCKVRIVMIVHPENKDDIEWFVNLAGRLGVEYYIGYSRHSQLLQHTARPDTLFTARDLEQIEQTLTRVGWLVGKRIDHWMWAKSTYVGNVVSFQCDMGRRALVVDPFGGVYPCNELLPTLHMGNLRDFDGDMDALLNAPKAQKIHNHIAQKRCQPCDMLCAHKILFPWHGSTKAVG